MGLREFRDSAGTAWMAWDVAPAREGAQVRSGVDRRADHTPGLERGWVCFESEGEKRRLAPPPGDRQEPADDALEALLGRAEPIVRRRMD